MRSRVWQYSPDIVLLELFVGNDLRTTFASEWPDAGAFFVHANGPSTRSRIARASRPAPYWMRDCSSIYGLQLVADVASRASNAREMARSE